MRMRKTMINETFRIEKKEAVSYPPIPENVYQCEVLDITMKESLNYKKTAKENVLDFQFTLLNGKDKSLISDANPTGSLRGRNLWRNFVPTFLYIGKNGKNVLYQIVEAIDGEEMSPEREATLDSQAINTLIGKQCRVVVKNKVDGEKIYSNIANFLPIENELPKLTPEEKDKAVVKNKPEKEEKNEVVYPEDEGEAELARFGL